MTYTNSELRSEMVSFDDNMAKLDAVGEAIDKLIEQKRLLIRELVAIAAIAGDSDGAYAIIRRRALNAIKEVR